MGTTISTALRGRMRLTSMPLPAPAPHVTAEPGREHVQRRPSRHDPRDPFISESPARQERLVSLHGVHVMVVEDDLDARNIFRRVLEHCGAVVTLAETATGALRRLRTMAGRPHVLVSDLALPGKDGYWLIRQVGAVKRISTIPAIAITAHRNEYDREETLAAGFQEYFNKPLDLIAFSRAIARLAGR
jgi:CheY-like chemotaxis protein